MQPNLDYSVVHDRVKRKVCHSQPFSLELVGKPGDKAISEDGSLKTLSQYTYKIVDSSGQTVASTYDLFWGGVICETLNHVRT